MRDVTRIVTGLRWKEALPPIVVAGAVTDDHLGHVREQAATLAAGRRRRRLLTRHAATALPTTAADRQARPMTAVELVVTDLDGTFWHTDDQLARAVLPAVAELERRGVPLLVATGRRLTSTRDPLARFGLAPPAVMLNGAIGLDLATVERFHLAPFPVDEALAAYDAFVAVGLSPVVYVDHPRYDVFISESPDTNPDHVQALGDTAGRPLGPEAGGGRRPPRRGGRGRRCWGSAMIGVPFDAAEAAFAALAGHRRGPPRPLDRVPGPGGDDRRAPRPVEVGRRARLLRHHGLDSTKVMAVADGPNDIELLTNAAVRVVPKIAHPSALELATTIIPSAQDGGWAEVPSLLD